MNYIDIIILVPTIYFAWNGFKKGFVISLFTLLALLVGLYAGIHFSDFLSEWLINEDIMTGEYTSPVAFTIVFLVVGAIVYFVGVLLQKIIKAVQLNTVNKLIGLILGLIKSAYILSFILVLVESYDQRGDFISEESKTESALYGPTKQICLSTLPAIKETLLLKIQDVQIFEE